jgi:peptidoglycan/xylan/chitin deacetylase (PgdA/CDA1 family)
MKNFIQLLAIIFLSIMAGSCACHCPPSSSEAAFPAAAQPPAGLLPSQVPQFIVCGSDDNGYSGLESPGATGGLHFLSELFSGLRNPAGSGNPLTFDASAPHYSFYVNTYTISSVAKKSAYDSAEMEKPVYVKRAWKEAMDNGHEIGVHTHSHPHGKEFSRRQWRKEIQRCIDILGQPYATDELQKRTARETGLGVDRGQLAGFRTPFLEYSDNTLQAVRRLEFLYDCSLEEGTQPDQTGGNFLWPYRLDYGSPGNSPLIGRHPGLWEIPVYVFIVPPDSECERYGVAPGLRAALQRRQNYFNPAAGKITGMDWNLWCEFAMTPAEFLATLKYTLDLRLNGNRCPLTIGLHSELYSDKEDTKGLNATAAERRAALREWFTYILRLPQVRLVNHRELLNWLQNPEALAAPTRPQAAAKEMLIGAKIYEYKNDFADLFAAWQRLGVNTAFVSVELAGNRAFMDLARDRKVAVYVIVPVFYNPEALAKDPGLFAITGHGLPAKADWVEFVCPRRPEYRRQRLEYVRRLIHECRPDGLSIDFIRYFAFWEMIYPDARQDPLQNTCFCPYCLQAFQRECKVNIPARLTDIPAKAEWILKNHLPAWSLWKQAAVTAMVREIAAVARQEMPGIKLNVHLVPWRKGDFGGAMDSVVSQDIAAIGPLVDYLSPMCYAHMVKQTPDWISSVVRDVQSQAANPVPQGDGGTPARPVIPSIQVKEDYIPEALTPAQFSDYLKAALEPPSQGVVFWSWETLAADAAKMEIARSLLAGPGASKNP